MDIGNLVTQDNANNGVWFQLVLYGCKQKVDVLIYGADSDRVQTHQREQLRKVKLELKKGKQNIEEIDDDTIDELLDSADDNVLVRIGGLRVHGKPDEELSIDGRTLKNDRDSFAYFIEKIPDAKSFILKKSNERLNFLADKKKS